MKRDVIIWAMDDIAEDLILNAQEVSDMKKNKSRTLRIALIAAAVVVLLAGTVLAATYKLWSPGLANWFGADEEAQEAMMDSGMTSMIYGEPVTLENGLTLEVQQVLCDGKETSITVQYSAPEAGWFTRENRKWASMITVPQFCIGSRTFQYTTGGFDKETITDTEAYMTWTFACDCSSFDGQIVTLTLLTGGDREEIAKRQDPDIPGSGEIIRNDPLLLSEDVSFSWTLDMSTAISKTLEGSFSETYNGSTVTLENVVLTPVSIRFTMTEGLELFDNPSKNADALHPTGIVLTDGTVIGWHTGGVGYHEVMPEEAEPETLPGYYTFDTTVLDLDSISGITFATWANTPVDSEVGDVTVFTLPLK